MNTKESKSTSSGKMKDSKEQQAIKSQQINLRVSVKELERIRQNAEISGLSISAYLLRCALNKKFTSRYDAQALYQLNRIGVNLNQISHNLNILAKFSTVAPTLEATKKALDELTNAVKKMNDDSKN